MKAMQRYFTFVVVAATICSLLYISPVPGHGHHFDLGYLQSNFQDDTIFGNYTYTYPNYYPWLVSVYIDVQDSDGVDSVWLSYRRENETLVLNQSMSRTVLGSGNRYVGDFRANVSQTVTGFIVQFHANDTLGHQASSIEYSLIVYYNPPDTLPNEDYGLQFIIGLSIALVSVVGLFYSWRKGRDRSDE